MPRHGILGGAAGRKRPLNAVQLGATWVHTLKPDTTAKRTVVSQTCEVQAVSINAFGSDLGATQSAGDTNWAGYNWTTLDGRITQMKQGARPGSTLAITLYGPPQWMIGLGANNYDDVPGGYYERQILPQYVDEWASLCAYISTRYLDVTHFQVWNELKGYYNDTENRYDYENYTTMYNAVWDAVKAVRPGARIGGPYTLIDAWMTPEYDGWGNLDTQAAYDLGGVSSSITGTGARPYYLDARNLDVLNYFRVNTHGVDFICIDMDLGLNLGNDGLGGTMYTNTVDRFSKAINWVAARFPNKPIWFSEYYYGTGGTTSFNLVKAEALATGKDVTFLCWHEAAGVTDLLFNSSGVRSAMGDTYASYLTARYRS